MPIQGLCRPEQHTAAPHDAVSQETWKKRLRKARKDVPRRAPHFNYRCGAVARPACPWLTGLGSRGLASGVPDARKGMAASCANGYGDGSPVECPGAGRHLRKTPRRTGNMYTDVSLFIDGAWTK